MTSTRRPYTAELRRGARRAEPAVSGDAPFEGGQSEVLEAIAGLSARMEALESRLPEPAAQTPESQPDAPPDPQADREPDPLSDPVQLERHKDEVRLLRMEITALARCIEETKTEIAKLRDERAEGDRLTAVTHELDAIVGATESATNGIMDIIEAVTSMVSEIQAQEKDSYIRQLADDIQDRLMSIYEHCNFQDLTGQRITKVVNTMKFIEERIDHMMDIWGRDGFLMSAEEEWLERRAEEEKRLLNGPQIGQKGISQDEIDALFD